MNKELELGIEALRSSTNIAVVGLSRHPGKAAHDIPILLSGRQYNVVGVNPNAGPEISGLTNVERIVDVELEIDILNVFRPSADTDVIIDEAIERNDLIGDISCIWLQEGITSHHGAEKCAEAGIAYLEDACIYVVYQYLRV
jgi:predicted CoA-binding protein